MLVMLEWRVKVGVSKVPVFIVFLLIFTRLP